MRRTFVVLVVLAALGIGSSAASAATRQSIAIRAVVAQASWENINEETGAGEFGVMQFAREKSGTTVFLSMSRGELVLCQGSETPDDQTDDFYGFVGSATQGEGRARLTVGRSFSSASGSGTINAEVLTVNECTGDAEATSRTSISVSLDLTSIGPVVTQKSRTTIAIPKQLRTKTFVQSKSREAAGTAVVGGRTIEVGGIVGELSLRGMMIAR